MRILFFVTLSHLLLIIALLYRQPLPPKSITRRPVAINTYVQKHALPTAEPPPPIEKITIAEPAQPEPVVLESIPVPPEPMAPPEPIAPKPTPKPVVKPSVKPANKPAAKPANKLAVKKEPSKNNPNQQKLISLMQQSLNTLNTTNPTPTATSTTQNKRTIGKLVSETLSFEAKYEEELVDYLESIFSFPEDGEVKLKLTLKREGTVQKLVILNATSERNRKYIESALSTCICPPFGSHFKGESVHTFTITLMTHLAHKMSP